MESKILIVGYGHVGRQIARWFPGAAHVDVDAQPYWTEDGTKAPMLGYDLGFICVPTPEGEGGRCDLSAVSLAWESWRDSARHWCVKSTVEVGTTERLGPNVCFSPEYYGETVAHPLVDSLPFVILGGPRETTNAFADAWAKVATSEVRIYQTDSRTAELCKLMENSFLAAKVTFCNEFFDLASAVDVDWRELRELWLADPRIGRSHTFVYPDNRGFGGSCLPKDTANLCAWARARGHPARLMEAVRAVNADIREHSLERIGSNG